MAEISTSSYILNVPVAECCTAVVGLSNTTSSMPCSVSFIEDNAAFAAAAADLDRRPPAGVC